MANKKISQLQYEMDFIERLLDAGILTVNELRENADLPPLPASKTNLEIQITVNVEQAKKSLAELRAELTAVGVAATFAAVAFDDFKRVTTPQVLPWYKRAAAQIKQWWKL